MRFSDRAQAGRLLPGRLDHLREGMALHRRLGPRLRCEHRLAVVQGADGPFDWPDALDTVARLAREWFTGHLASSARPSA